MSIVVIGFGLYEVVVGVLGFVAPERTKPLARTFVNRAGLYVGAGLRLLLGFALLVAAPTSRWPDLLPSLV